jgi:hypothetical protein
MDLCQACKSIPFSLFTNPPNSNPKSWHLHHPSYQSLERSANAGCIFCGFIYAKISPTQRLGPYPCFEVVGYDPILFPQRRENAWKDDRMFLHLAKPHHQQSGSSGIILVCRCGEYGNVFNFDLEYSGDVSSSTLYPKGHGAVSLIKFWLDTCFESHISCAVLYDNGFMPSRLLDVGCHGQNFICLKDSGFSSKLQSSRYLTLSHCWGRSMPGFAKTTTKNYDDNFRRIRIRNLPRTYRDAISLTRRLGYRYIWIDSLCIIQDSAADWSRESAAMGKIYSHSFCTLAAAASDDCHGGLFPLRKELPIFQLEESVTNTQSSSFVLIKQAYRGWDELFDSSSLNTRGWTLQERELSSRIIYFTKHTMLFECRETRGSEGGGDKVNSLGRYGSQPLDSQIHPRYVLTAKTSIEKTDTRRCMDKLPLDSNPENKSRRLLNKRYQTWREMVQRYSARDLTIATDRFPALSGLASEMTYLLNDEYIAGLWRNEIKSGLCWTYPLTHQIGSARQTNYGPSWSWAATSAPISYELVNWNEKGQPARKPTTVRAVKGARTWPLSHGDKTLSNTDNDPPWKDVFEPRLLTISKILAGDDPNGTLISASLQFEGQVIPIQRSKTGDCIIDGTRIEVMWDYLPQPLSEIFLFSLGIISVGLVLTEVSKDDSVYKRVGILSEMELSWFRDVDTGAITLV